MEVLDLIFLVLTCLGDGSPNGVDVQELKFIMSEIPNWMSVEVLAKLVWSKVVIWVSWEGAMSNESISSSLILGVNDIFLAAYILFWLKLLEKDA